MTKIPALGALTSLATTDELYIVDKSDTTDDATGSSKKVTVSTIRSDVRSVLQVNLCTGLNALSGYSSNELVETKGHTSVGDGGGGVFWLDTSGSLGASAEDNGVIFPSSIGSNYYWRRKTDGLTPRPEWWGAVGDNSTDDSTAIQAALDSSLLNLEMNGTYKATGLQLAVNNKTVFGNGTISLIDNSSDTELFLVTGCSGFLVQGLTFYGNRGHSTRPAQGTGGVRIASTATKGRFEKCKFFHARTQSPALANEQSNIVIQSPSVTLHDCESTDSWQNNYDFQGTNTQQQCLDCKSILTATVTGTHTGSDNASVLSDSTKTWTTNEWVGFTINNISDGSTAVITSNTSTTVTATLSGGTDNDWDSTGTPDSYEILSPTLKGLRVGGGASADGITFVASNFQSDDTLQMDWTGENVPRIMEHAVIKGAIIRSRNRNAAKFAHMRNLEIDGGRYESLRELEEGLVFGERLNEVVIRNAFIKSPGGSSNSNSHIDHFPAGNKCCNINTMIIENCVIGGSGADPEGDWDEFAVNLRCFKLVFKNNIVNNFATAALRVYPGPTDSDTWGVEEIGLNTTPGSPATNAVYGVGGSPTGQWATDGAPEHSLAWWNGTAWLYEEPASGNGLLKYDTRIWVKNETAVASGSDDTSTNANFLTDSGESWTTNEWVGYTIKNTTDGCEAVILSNTATTITTSRLLGGTGNNWNSGDAYEIIPRGWYRYINETTGWIRVENELCGWEVTGNTFIGKKDGSVLAIFGNSGFTTESFALMKDSRIVRCYDNKIINLGTGGTAMTRSASLDPTWQQRGPGRWYHTAAPTRGIWWGGEQIEKSNAAAAGAPGWVNTTPGDAFHGETVFKAMAVLAS